MWFDLLRTSVNICSFADELSRIQSTDAQRLQSVGWNNEERVDRLRKSLYLGRVLSDLGIMPFVPYTVAHYSFVRQGELFSKAMPRTQRQYRWILSLIIVACVLDAALALTIARDRFHHVDFWNNAFPPILALFCSIAACSTFMVLIVGGVIPDKRLRGAACEESLIAFEKAPLPPRYVTETVESILKKVPDAVFLVSCWTVFKEPCNYFLVIQGPCEEHYYLEVWGKQGSNGERYL